MCTCSPGWGGVNCDQNVNECASSPCQNGGTCWDGLNGFTCTCNAQWTGPLCQTPQQGKRPGEGGFVWGEGGRVLVGRAEIESSAVLGRVI